MAHATDQRETVLAAVEALERKLAREVQAVPTATQLNTLLDERLAEFEAVSKVQGGRLDTVEATADQASWGRAPRRLANQHPAHPPPSSSPLSPSYTLGED